MTTSEGDLGGSLNFTAPAAAALAASPGATPAVGPGEVAVPHFFVLSFATSEVSLATSVDCFLNSSLQAPIDLSVLA